MKFPTLSAIRVGEPDANAEYFSALRGKTKPIFLDSFMTIPHLPIGELQLGEKFLVYGQKGTGKTAILRYLQSQPSGSKSEFLIFKKSFMEEVDVQQYAKIPLLVDEETLKSFKHYHHTVKRILIFILIRMSFTGPPADAEIADLETEESRSLVKKIADSAVGDAIRLGFDSIRSLFSAAGFDLEKVSAEKFLLDAGRLLKRSNDDILSFLCKRLRRSRQKLRLYVDEIHFAYRSEESLQQDAILVRDTILAIQNLNDRFAEEGVEAIVYAAIRSEYLEHPIISTADINHTVESVGYNISWATFPEGRSHPLFFLIYLRFKASIGGGLTFDDFFGVYLANIDEIQFLRRTWAKPRDFIRFFKCAKNLYPMKASLTSQQLNAVWRVYAQEAWNEMKSSASPFLSPPALVALENSLRKVVPGIFDRNVEMNLDSFSKMVRPIYDIAKGSLVNFYDFDHFLNLLYILGLFQTRRRNPNSEDIWQSYHRGNKSFHRDGQVLIHPVVLKAFG